MPILGIFGIFELIAISIFLILMVIGTVADRNGAYAVKWYVLLVGVVFLAIWTWGDISISDVWARMQTWEMWQPVLTFVAIGLAYSGVEFLLHVRKRKIQVAYVWKSLMKTNVDVTLDPDNRRVLREATTMTVAELINKAQDAATNPDSDPILTAHLASLTHKVVYRHVGNDFRLSSSFVDIVVPDNTWTPVPEVNVSKLSDHVAAWTVLWPFYAVSLVIGDLLAHAFDAIAHVVKGLSGRFINATFKNTFKV